MRKGPLPLAAALLAALLLAACGGDDDSASSAATAEGGGMSAAASASSTASTAAGGASTTAAGIARGADPEVDEVVAAYSAVSDSAVPHDAKAALHRTAVRQEGTWKVTRDEFCSFMASARTPCPAN